MSHFPGWVPQLPRAHGREGNAGRLPLTGFRQAQSQDLGQLLLASNIVKSHHCKTGHLERKGQAFGSHEI
jgi:hypothetical protein